MSKIIIINSSLRKKATYSILKRLEGLLQNHSVEFLNLKQYNILPCTGCENCIRKGKCNIKDEADIVLSKMQNADGIILGSPVYLRQVSGYLKLLIDRGCSWYHRSPLIGKPILFVTATQATGSKQAVRYLNDLSLQWGTINTGVISKTMFNLDKEIKPDSITKFQTYLDPKNLSKYRPGLKQVIEFNTQKVLAMNILPLDLAHWTEKGYIDQAYYYKCKINIFNRVIGYLYYRILSYFIVKNRTEKSQ